MQEMIGKKKKIFFYLEDSWNVKLNRRTLTYKRRFGYKIFIVTIKAVLANPIGNLTLRLSMYVIRKNIMQNLLRRDAHGKHTQQKCA